MQPLQHRIEFTNDELKRLDGLVAGFVDKRMKELCESIERACARSARDALGRGVLVETWFLGRFKVSLSADVPAGEIHERRHMSEMPAEGCGGDRLCVAAYHRHGCANDPGKGNCDESSHV